MIIPPKKLIFASGDKFQNAVFTKNKFSPEASPESTRIN